MFTLPIIALVSGLAPVPLAPVPIVTTPNRVILIQYAPSDALTARSGPNHAELARQRLDHLVAEADARLHAQLVDRTRNPGHPALAYAPVRPAVTQAQESSVTDWRAETPGAGARQPHEPK